MNAASWLKKAISHDKSRTELCAIHDTWASDGFRMHVCGEIESGGKATEVIRVMTDARQRAEDEQNCLAVVTNHHLTAIGKVAMAYREGKSLPIRLVFNGALEAVCHNLETGAMHATITDGMRWQDHFDENSGAYHVSTVTYLHRGQDGQIVVNTRFLIEALSGMGRDVILSAPGGRHPLYLTDGEREALIMPMDDDLLPYSTLVAEANCALAPGPAEPAVAYLSPDPDADKE